MGQSSSALTMGEEGENFAMNPNKSVDESFDAVSFVDPNGEQMLNDHENFHLENSDASDSVDEDCVANSRCASFRSSSVDNRDMSLESEHSLIRSSSMRISRQNVSTGKSKNEHSSSAMEMSVQVFKKSYKASAAESVAEANQQSSASMTRDPAKALPNLLTLSNSEIKSRIKDIDFKSNHIKMISHSINLPDDLFSWYQSPGAIEINKKNGFITINDASSFEKNHMEVAMFILKVSPIIRNVRFKMVPAKLSESSFWNAVFYLIQSKGKLPSPRPSCIGTANQLSVEDVDLRALLEEKNTEISRLKEEILQTQKALKEIKENMTNENKVCVQHEGEWVMDAESIDFLSLDEEIKNKLREAKRKRLADVQEQMKFILDTDDFRDSHGKWTCCGETEYISEKCTNA